MPRTATTRTTKLPSDPKSGFRRAIRRWAKLWRVDGLAETTVEWSPRLTRSLGRAYPQRMLIRLHARLREPRYSTLLREVLCHELAHLAVFVLHGRDASLHGPEWRRLVERAGYEPCTGIHIPDLIARESSRVRFEHFCPTCKAKRWAKRRQPTWRCVECRRHGLEGTLIIRPCPATDEVRNGR